MSQSSGKNSFKEESKPFRVTLKESEVQEAASKLSLLLLELKSKLLDYSASSRLQKKRDV